MLKCDLGYKVFFKIRLFRIQSWTRGFVFYDVYEIKILTLKVFIEKI